MCYEIEMSLKISLSWGICIRDSVTNSLIVDMNSSRRA
jgi:hypothetical protein